MTRHLSLLAHLARAPRGGPGAPNPVDSAPPVGGTESGDAASRRSGGGGVLDLSRDPTFTFRLLEDPSRWRERVVEELHLHDRDHAQVRINHQLRLPTGLLAAHGITHRPDRVRCIVPLATRPKRPLLGFDASGPGGSPAVLLLRSQATHLQASYLGAIADTSPAADTLAGLVDVDLLRGICLFSPDLVRRYAAIDTADDLQHYLDDGLDRPVDRKAIDAVLPGLAASATILRSYRQHDRDEPSAAEQPLLAVPRMLRPPPDDAALVAAMERYAAFVTRLAEGEDDYLLTMLAEYGYRWQMCLELELPVDAAANVKLRETRPITLARRGQVTLDVVTDEAPSWHLEVLIDDPHVVMSKRAPSITDADGHEVGVPILEGVRLTRESLAIYTADATRPGHLWLRPRLQLHLGNRIAGILVLALTAAATVTAILVPPGDQVLPVLALLTLPTTFAVTIVLGREHSALAVRLQTWPRVAMAVLAAGLWAVAFYRLVQHLVG